MELSLESVKKIEGYSTESLGSFVPFVRVVEKGDYIEVQGFRSYNFEQSLKKAFKTSRVYTGIFIDKNFRSLRCHKFYAIELAYVCGKLIEGGGYSCSVSDLKSIIRGLYENTWLFKTKEETLRLDTYPEKIRSEMTVTPFDYQLAFLEDYANVAPKYNLKGYLAELAAGSGKTLLAYFFSLYFDSDVMLIICPKPVVEQIWVHSANEYFKRPKAVWDSVSGGNITGREDYIICHYQAIDNVIKDLRKFKGKKITLWIDESHKVTEETSKIVNDVYKIIDEYHVEHTIHASATPLKARPIEAIPLLKTIDPLFKGEAVDSYTKVFGSSKAVALDILNNRLGIVKFKVTKEQYSKIQETDLDVKVSFPGSEKYEMDNVGNLMQEAVKSYVAEYIDNKDMIVNKFNMLHSLVVQRSKDKDTLKRYKSMADKMHKNFNPFEDKEYIRECKAIEKLYHLQLLNNEEKKEFRSVVAMYKYPKLSIRGKVLGNVLGKLRTECFVRIAAEMELNKIIDASIKKTVIFTSYVDVLKEAERFCKEKGYNPIVIYQDTNKDLKSLLKSAEVDESVNPIIATYESLGTGNELVMCSSFVAIDVPFREYSYTQAKARINRASQDTDVTYFKAVLDTGDKPNLSTRNLEILQWSGDMVDQMLGVTGTDYSNLDNDEEESGEMGFNKY